MHRTDAAWVFEAFGRRYMAELLEGIAMDKHAAINEWEVELLIIFAHATLQRAPRLWADIGDYAMNAIKYAQSKDGLGEEVHTEQYRKHHAYGVACEVIFQRYVNAMDYGDIRSMFHPTEKRDWGPMLQSEARVGW